MFGFFEHICSFSESRAFARLCCDWVNFSGACERPGNSTGCKTELKTSLSDLSTLYQTEVQRLEKRQQQSKELYNDGLISRIEFENGEKALADARAKVEQVTKEIAAASQPTALIAEDIVSEYVCG